MKPLTLFLFLSLSLAGFGQIKIDSTVTYPIYWPDTVSLPCQPIYDTIPVVMLVSDTTPVNQEYWKSLGNGLIQKETVSIVSSEMWQMVGYEVTELVPLTPMFTPLAGADAMIYNPNATYTTKTITYLDHAKKPLNLCVWGTKERK
jgi:hypothetical protein